MTREQIMDEASRLKLSEQLLLVEELWDAIAVHSADIPMPEWQKQELDKRHEEYQKGGLGLHDWTSVHEELRNRYK